ncbi:MAG: hypothetical protein U1F14_10925 [Steroidobacteraceae bacterium]
MNRSAPLAACALLLVAASAHAGPADYVYTPNVEYGERELDLKMGSAGDNDAGGESRSAGSIGFGLGAAKRWFTELYVKFEKESGEKLRYEAIEWENKFQLTESGQLPVDIGFLLELERPRDRAEGYEAKWGPLFQRDWGRFQLNANLLFERMFHSDEPEETELGYQLQVKYRWRREFEYGMQAFGDLGRWDEWAPAREQEHRVGPAVFGKFSTSDHHTIAYNAAMLFGLTAATPDVTFRLQAEYEF